MENEYQYWKQKGLEVFRKQLQQEVVDKTQKIANIMIEHQIKQLENDEWGDWMDLKQLCEL
jgi:hypothetical protein